MTQGPSLRRLNHTVRIRTYIALGMGFTLQDVIGFILRCFENDIIMTSFNLADYSIWQTFKWRCVTVWICVTVFNRCLVFFTGGIGTLSETSTEGEATDFILPSIERGS